MTSTDIRSELESFTGTEHWYRHPLVRSVIYTDGVKYFADKMGAYWMIDIFATELFKLQRDHGFLAITALVVGSRAALVATDGNRNMVWSRNIEFTDCREGEWAFYFVGDCIMLPSEY